mmetsp:Transcript_35837/g.68756  ORF Transcript_35837/g.68756 Transcript_35837/m.68756 type:complete len:104 (+) Transcript_35837:2227-2538(+)
MHEELKLAGRALLAVCAAQPSANPSQSRRLEEKQGENQTERTWSARRSLTRVLEWMGCESLLLLYQAANDAVRAAAFLGIVEYVAPQHAYARMDSFFCNVFME